MSYHPGRLPRLLGMDITGSVLADVLLFLVKTCMMECVPSWYNAFCQISPYFLGVILILNRNTLMVDLVICVCGSLGMLCSLDLLLLVSFLFAVATVAYGRKCLWCLRLRSIVVGRCVDQSI